MMLLRRKGHQYVDSFELLTNPTFSNVSEASCLRCELNFGIVIYFLSHGVYKISLFSHLFTDTRLPERSLWLVVCTII